MRSRTQGLVALIPEKGLSDEFGSITSGPWSSFAVVLGPNHPFVTVTMEEPNELDMWYVEDGAAWQAATSPRVQRTGEQAGIGSRRPARVQL